MSDDPSKRGPADRERINVHEPYEVRYWCGQFGCSEHELRQAVAQVGPMVSNVRRHLKK